MQEAAAVEDAVDHGGEVVTAQDVAPGLERLTLLRDGMARSCTDRVDLFLSAPVALASRSGWVWVPEIKDVFVATPEEIKTSQDVAGTLVRAALLGGRVLYERPGGRSN